MSFQHAASGLPANITFSKHDFIRPIRPNPSGNALVTRLATTTTASVIVKESDDTVVLDLQPEDASEKKAENIDSIE